MNEFTVKHLEELCIQVGFPTVQNLGNGLYKIMPMGIICGSTFLERLDMEILKLIKEYNTDTSAEHSYE